MGDVIVIGGGAAGLAAAISAASYGANVTVLEATDRVGSKILATGNGRCNLTNAGVSAAAYNCPSFVAPLLEAFDAERIRGWFKQQGLLTVEEREGRVYPLSNTATSVVDVLRAACDRAGVQIVCGFDTDVITHDGERILVGSPSKGSGMADAVIVACGGGSRLIAQCGHELAPMRPVLCPVATDTDTLRGLSGVRVQAKVSAYGSTATTEPYFSETGEVLFRDYGISGIVVFNLSRVVEPGHKITLDLLPSMDEEEFASLLLQRMNTLAPVTRTLRGEVEKGVPSNEMLLRGIFHPRICTAIMRAAHCKPSLEADDASIIAMVQTAKAFKLTCKGPGDEKHAQVTRGGALVEQFDPLTLESRLMPGLYCVGETLNVDGACGGFNLHWAWASGLAAGRAAAKRS